jgi:predicted MFS family arabinose efflux permease
MLKIRNFDGDTKLLISTWAAADGLGNVILLAMPFMIGAFVVQLGFSLSEAGMVLSVEMGMIAVVSMAIAPLMSKLSRSQVAITGAIIAVIANILCIYTTEYESILWFRAISGLGYGLAMAAGNAAVASADNPAQTFERKMILFGLYQVVLMLSIPFILNIAGLEGFFAILALMAFLLIFLVMKLPSYATRSVDDREPNERQLSDNNSTVSILAAALIILAMSIYSLREAFAWAFLERIGDSLSVSAQLVGVYMAVASVVGLVGPAIATRLRKYAGATRSAVLGMVLSGLVTYGIVVTDTQNIYYAMIIVWPLIYYFTIPLIMGIATALDSKGRVAAATAGALILAYSLGPVVAGFIYEKGGQDVIGNVTLAAMIVSVLLLLLASTKIKKETISSDTSD